LVTVCSASKAAKLAKGRVSSDNTDSKTATLAERSSS
jgi:hypothetical protein